MNKTALGFVSGLVLGLLDGVSAFLNPEAAGMMPMIITSATVKGAITGALVGFICTRMQTSGRGSLMLIGAAIGFVLSVLAAVPSGSYVEIVISGTVLGLLVGFIVARWGT